MIRKTTMQELVRPTINKRTTLAMIGAMKRAQKSQAKVLKQAARIEEEA